MNNLAQRIIAGVIGGALMLAAIWYDYTTFIALFFLINLLSSIEYHQMLNTAGIATNKWGGIAGGVIVYCLFALNTVSYIPEMAQIAFVALLFMILMMIELFSTHGQPLQRIAYTAFGILYIAVPFGLLTMIPININAYSADLLISTPYQYKIIYALLFLIWANDTGAYFAGKTLGKHKLFERISPKKTWEGTIGGFVTALGITLLMHHFYGIYSLPEWIGLCIVIVISGSIGDLAESMIKRNLNVKDSGTMIPGHGGFLDRFDALIFAIPFVFVYLLLLTAF